MKYDYINSWMHYFLVLVYAEDFETSLSDYQKALSILEQLVEPDDRKIADLYPWFNSYLNVCFFLVSVNFLVSMHVINLRT